MAIEFGAGRPKAIIKRERQLNLKLTDFEFKKIARVAKEKNLTKTAAILQGIDLLEHDKPKILRSQLNKQKNIQPKIEKNSVGVIEGETIMFDK